MKEFNSIEQKNISDTRKEKVSDVQTAFATDSLSAEKLSTAEKYENYVSSALEKKEYTHWTSSEQQEINRQLVTDYHLKKIEADRASLLTQKDILTRYREKFDSSGIQRMSSELGSNKLEIYNDEYFLHNISGDEHPTVVGCREFPSGKICVKDTNDIQSLKHTSSHETMHDLSFQSADHRSETIPIGDGKFKTESIESLQSGIEKIEKIMLINGDGTTICSEIIRNYSLNEGLTEMYTVESMQMRGDNPGLSGYTMERAWAITLKEKLGDDIVADAYFSGKVDLLEAAFNQRTNIPEAWNRLNAAIDGYGRSKEGTEASKEYYKLVWNLFDSLDSTRTLEKGGMM